jgi:hypothetical protein
MLSLEDLLELHAARANIRDAAAAHAVSRQRFVLMEVPFQPALTMPGISLGWKLNAAIFVDREPLEC